MPIDTIPPFRAFRAITLRALSDGSAKSTEALSAFVIKYFDFSEEQKEETVKSGSTRVANRVAWAVTYLYQSGLIQRVQRGIYQITEEGKAVNAQNLPELSDSFLNQYPTFREFKARKGTLSSKGEAGAPSLNKVEAITPSIGEGESQTPDEMFSQALDDINAKLEDELLEAMLRLEPRQFEHLVSKLLTRLGYGKGEEAQAQVTQYSRDGGIDGYVWEDKLGLDIVAYQAKRYAAGNTISSREIQMFIGSLDQVRCQKGIFVTTSDFSRDAHQTAKTSTKNIVLINGNRLAELMREHGVGTRIKSTHTIQAIDSDFFEEF